MIPSNALHSCCQPPITAAQKTGIITALLSALQDKYSLSRWSAASTLTELNQTQLSDEQINLIISDLIKAFKYYKDKVILNTLRKYFQHHKFKLSEGLFKQVLSCLTNPLSYISEQSIIMAVQRKQTKKLIAYFNKEKIRDLINHIELNHKSTEYIVAMIQIIDAIADRFDPSTGEYYEWMEKKSDLVDELVLRSLFANDDCDIPRISEVFLTWPKSTAANKKEAPSLHQLLKDMYYFWSENALYQFEVAYVTKHIKEIFMSNNSKYASALRSLKRIELSEHFLRKVVQKLIEIFTNKKRPGLYRKQACSELNALACKVIFPEELLPHVFEQLINARSDTVIKHEVTQTIGNVVTIRNNPVEKPQEYGHSTLPQETQIQLISDLLNQALTDTDEEARQFAARALCKFPLSSIPEQLQQPIMSLKADQVLTEEDWDKRVHAAETLRIVSESGIYEALVVHRILLERSAQTQYPKLLKMNLINELLNFESDDEKLVLLTTQILGRWLEKTLPNDLQEKIIDRLKSLAKDHKSQKVRELAQQNLESVKQSQASTKEPCSLPAVTTNIESPVEACDLQSPMAMPHDREDFDGLEGGASKDIVPYK